MSEAVKGWRAVMGEKPEELEGSPPRELHPPGTVRSVAVRALWPQATEAGSGQVKQRKCKRK